MIVITIPLSVQISKIIENTYSDISSEIVLDNITDTSEIIEDNKEEKQGFFERYS